jgi:hypothetical protein
MALVVVLCSACSHIGFARANPLPRVLTCSPCHSRKRFEIRQSRQRPAKREDAPRQDIEDYSEGLGL